MGCCNNKKNCENRQEMTDLTSWVLKGLLDVVRTGHISALFKNPAADELALMIVKLIDENKYLRAMLGFSRPETTVTATQFQISFGPGKHYNLTIPVTTESTRVELIESLRVAIQQLQARAPEAEKNQLPLFDAVN